MRHPSQLVHNKRRSLIMTSKLPSSQTSLFIDRDMTIKVHIVEQESSQDNNLTHLFFGCMNNGPISTSFSNAGSMMKEMAKQVCSHITHFHKKYPHLVTIMVVDDIGQVISPDDLIHNPNIIEDSLWWVDMYGGISISNNNEVLDFVRRFTSEYGHQFSDEQLRFLIRTSIFNYSDRLNLKNEIESIDVDSKGSAYSSLIVDYDTLCVNFWSCNDKRGIHKQLFIKELKIFTDIVKKCTPHQP